MHRRNNEVESQKLTRYKMMSKNAVRKGEFLQKGNLV